MRLLVKKKQKEAQLRQDGKLDEMSQLIPNTRKVRHLSEVKMRMIYL